MSNAFLSTEFNDVDVVVVPHCKVCNFGIALVRTYHTCSQIDLEDSTAAKLGRMQVSRTPRQPLASFLSRRLRSERLTLIQVKYDK
jgi:hypothetical protein